MNLTYTRMPERLHHKWEQERPALLRCTVSVLVIGLACHAAGLFSGMSFYDDVTCLYDVGTTHIFGRFTLALLGKLTRLPFGGSNYSLPWFNGLSSFLLLGLFAWMTVRLLHIRGKWMQILVCGLLVSFPVITSLFAYGFTAPYYMLALPMCGFSAYCLTLRGGAEKKTEQGTEKRSGKGAEKGAEKGTGFPGRLHGMLLPAAGILSMGLMLGIYQAYLPVLLSLEVLILIRDEMEGGERHRGRQKRRWACALGGTILGFVLYLVLMKASLAVTGKALYAYRGLETLGSEGSSYLERILWAYRIFFVPESFEKLRGSTDYLMFMWSMGTVYRIILAVSILLAAVGALLLCNRYRKRGRDFKTHSFSARESAGGIAVAIAGADRTVKVPAEGPQRDRSCSRNVRGSLVRYLILTALFPLTVNFVFVMTDFDVYSMMLYGQVFVLLYPVMMVEGLRGAAPAWRCRDRKRGAEGALRGIRLLTAALAVYSIVFYCRYANLCYYKAGRMQDAAIAYDEVLIQRIQQVEGYETSLPVCFRNEYEKDVTGWTVDEELAGANITPYTGLEIINCYSWVNFMKVHCGYAPTVIENYGQYENYVEEEEMPSYPAEGAIRVVDGVILVNF